MDQNRWNDINRIFHAALDVDPDQRSALVAAESNGDPELQSEVNRLLAADSEAGSYLETPLIASEALTAAPLAPGDVLCRRFRILRPIAEGGMGHVFEAFDTELAVHVALKVIQPEIAANPEAIARFRQEVRLARSITHPNICRTFDIERETRTVNGRHSEMVFLTMEFLSGETLATRIKRGPIPIAEALTIARQIAAALQAAHTLGVIHRDMKPANIMLVDSGSSTPRAVVTDFGLARLDPMLITGGLTSYTTTNRPIGTLAYMAPEQLEGAAVSPATDIYAFGLILFEMLTAKRAFASNNLLSGIAQRLRGTLSLDQQLPADTPTNWRRTLDACLNVTPEDRPQSATEVIHALEDPRTRIFHRTASSRKRSRDLRPRLIAAAIAFVAALALFTFGLRFYQSKADSKVTPGALVYLTKIDNRTGKQSFDILNELIQAGLSQSMQVNLLDQGRVGDILQQMTKSPSTAIDPATAREIAMRAGAARVIFATITGSNGTYNLNIDIQQPDNTPTRYRDHWTKTFTWHDASQGNSSGTIPPEILTNIRDANDWIRKEVGESANDIARLNTPPEDITTNSWEALDEYLHALQLKYENRPADAVVALHNAIQIDPQFALALGTLADIQFTLHHELEGFEDYRKALDPGLERRLSRRERDRIEGMYSIDSGDYAAAVVAFRDYQTFYPNDKLGWLYSEEPLMYLGRNDEAIANLKRALQLDPGNPFALEELATEYIITDNLGAATNALSQINDPAAVATSNAKRGVIAFLEGHYDQAQTLFSSLETSPDTRLRSRGFDLLADLAAERGDYIGAVHILDEGIHEDAATGNPEAQSSKLAGRAWMKAKLADFTGCATDLRAAVAANHGPEVLLMVATILGQAVQIAPPRYAPMLRQQMVEMNGNLSLSDYGMISRLLSMRFRAEASLAEGNTDSALKQFRDLSAIDVPAAPREYLGRALLIAAASSGTADRTHVLQVEAQQAYASIALRPGFIWHYPIAYPPGFLSDSLTSYIHLSNLLADNSTQAQQARARLNILRRNNP